MTLILSKGTDCPYSEARGPDRSNLCLSDRHIQEKDVTENCNSRRGFDGGGGVAGGVRMICVGRGLVHFSLGLSNE